MGFQDDKTLTIIIVLDYLSCKPERPAFNQDRSFCSGEYGLGRYPRMAAARMAKKALSSAGIRRLRPTQARL
jgi:hypothetical protein